MNASNFDEILKGKNVIAIGDSLLYGNLLGKSQSWLRYMEKANQMSCMNFGINGSTIAVPKDFGEGFPYEPSPMVERFEFEVENVLKIGFDVDIIIIQGGANDFNLNVYIGSLGEERKDTFYGALKIMTEKFSHIFPKAKLVCFSNFKRKEENLRNNLGYREIDYVDAMKDFCRNSGIPFYDSYRKSGIDFTDMNTCLWADEGIYLADEVNRHLSPKGNEYMSKIYGDFLKKLF